MGILTSLLLIWITLFGRTDELIENSTTAKSSTTAKAALKVMVTQPGLSLGKTTVKIVVQNNPDKIMEIRIRDANGHLIFNDLVKNQENFSKSYVLNQLSAGKYYLEVLNKKDIISEELSID